MNYTFEDEQKAREEYQSMIDTLQSADEFKNEWTGHWDDFEKKLFGGKTTKVNGDKKKYMKYWLEDQKVINDLNWDKIEVEENYE